MKEMKGLIKFGIVLVCMVIWGGCATEIQITPRPGEPPPPPTSRIHLRDLKVLQLEMSPDPIRVGQRVSFQALVANFSSYSARVNLFIMDRDEIITQVYDIFLLPGENRVIFPQTYYRFSRNEYCFTVEMDIERTRSPIDLTKKFCAQKTHQGWTMASHRIGPLFVEDLDLMPDPVFPGQEVLFKTRLRNEGGPLRTNIQIQDRDQVVTQLNDVLLPRGVSDLLFPSTRYQFQRSDHCFIVIVDVERTPYRVDAAHEFCARPRGRGWTLRP